MMPQTSSTAWKIFAVPSNPPTMDHTFTRREKEALRALAAGPGGIRHGAYPSVMPRLVELGLVRESVVKAEGKRPIWLLTPAGRYQVKVLGRGEPKE